MQLYGMNLESHLTSLLLINNKTFLCCVIYISYSMQIWDNSLYIKHGVSCNNELLEKKASSSL